MTEMVFVKRALVRARAAQVARRGAARRRLQRGRGRPAARDRVDEEVRERGVAVPVERAHHALVARGGGVGPLALGEARAREAPNRAREGAAGLGDVKLAKALGREGSVRVEPKARGARRAARV